MSNIASVLDSYKRGDQQQMLAKVQALASETPEVSATFKEVIMTLINSIENDIQPMITSGKDTTEGEINSRIGTLEDAATAVATAYDNAEGADKILYECMSEEKTHQETSEQEKAEMEQAHADTEAPCTNKDNNRVYTWEEQDPLSFSCDFSVPETEATSCSKQMESLESQVQAKLESLDASSGNQVQSWNTYNDECNHAWEVHANATTDHNNAVTAHEEKQAECAALKTTRDQQVCSFGKEVQHKCEAFDAYNSIVADLDTAGNEHSQVDRIAEWAETEQTKCLLQAHYDDGVLSDTTQARASIERCVAAADFEGQGGDLARESKQARVDAVMVPIDNNEEYRCEAGKPFSFYNGNEWIVDTAAIPASAGYSTRPFKPQIVLDPEQDPFENCQVEQSPGNPGKSGK